MSLLITVHCRNATIMSATQSSYSPRNHDCTIIIARDCCTEWKQEENMKPTHTAFPFHAETLKCWWLRMRIWWWWQKIIIEASFSAGQTFTTAKFRQISTKQEVCVRVCVFAHVMLFKLFNQTNFRLQVTGKVVT